MRWCWVLLLLMGCTSAWERHQAQLARTEASGTYDAAVAEERWLIDNAFFEAPELERSAPAEADRYIHLAVLAAKSGRTNMAREALRQALASDPHKAAAVRDTLNQLPLPPADRERFQQEFAWNMAALAPGEGFSADAGQCWSYRVREVRQRHRRTVQTPEGPQHEVTYDARPWAFDAHSRQWQAEGPWIEDVGSEAELVHGPEQPRYRALTAAEHEFYADDPIPPCHRSSWQGPYDPKGTLFVAAHLPDTAADTSQ